MFNILSFLQGGWPLLRTFLKISTLDVSETVRFFCMWLRIFNLQKLMQFNFRGRFPFLHKGPKLGFSFFVLFFQKILPSDFLGLIVNKNSCNSHCKPYVKKTLFLRYSLKCF